MYRFLLTPRWIALVLVVAAAIPGCVLLGRWQLDRLDRAEAHNARIHRNAEGPAGDPGVLSPVGVAVSKEREYSAVHVVGRYDLERSLLVRNRPANGRPGFHLLTPLVAATGSATLVDRGWIAAPSAGGAPTPPPGPAGQVNVTGLLRVAEPPRGGRDLPPGQVLRIDVTGIAAGLPYPVHGGYLALRTQNPAPPVIDGAFSPEPVPLPSGRTELLHLAYAWQWFVFAAIGPLGFWFLARREAADRRTLLPPLNRAL